MERVITIKEAPVLKTGNSNRGPWTLSAVKDENGEGYTTFDNALRELAAGNIGATAKIVFTEKNGKVNLESLTILSEAPVSPSNGLTQLPLAPATSPESRGGYSEERQKAIMRQTAAKVAAHIESAHPDPAGFDLYAFLELAEKLLGYFEGGVVDEATAVPFGE